MPKAELRVVVEGWEPQDEHNWVKWYKVSQCYFRKEIETEMQLGVGMEFQPSSQYDSRGIESAFYDMERGILVLELQRIRELVPHEGMIRQELSDDNWEIIPWCGDFGE